MMSKNLRKQNLRRQYLKKLNQLLMKMVKRERKKNLSPNHLK